MQQSYVDFIYLHPKQSVLLQSALAILHLLALVGIGLAGFDPLWQCLLILTVLVHFTLMYKRYFLNLPEYQLSYDPKQHWLLYSNTDSPEQITLLPNTLSTAFLVVLHAQLENGEIRHLIFFKDALPDDHFRRFRVMIRLYSALERQHESRI